MGIIQNFWEHLRTLKVTYEHLEAVRIRKNLWEHLRLDITWDCRDAGGVKWRHLLIHEGNIAWEEAILSQVVVCRESVAERRKERKGDREGRKGRSEEEI